MEDQADHINDHISDHINQAVGERLRQARRHRSWSLLDVEQASGGEFKASVLGAYERGERALSVSRLIRLAEILDVSSVSLLPGATGDGETVIDLTMDRQFDEPSSAVDDFLGAIRSMRRGSDGPVLAVRQADIRVMSALIDANKVVDMVHRDADDG